ncbi:hypothetical protein Mapa_000724 [Marchantia paleacea]|nr:hypothetical protein Mapa_000724 [Marchantia paleacea]
MVYCTVSKQFWIYFGNDFCRIYFPLHENRPTPMDAAATTATRRRTMSGIDFKNVPIYVLLIYD